jgi:glutamate formiminotransferase
MARALFESVPNVSDGGDAATIAACEAALAGAGATVVDRSSDPDHDRSVFTCFGGRSELVAASVALARVTTERIDLRRRRGVHPRIGALDVLPFVPIANATLADAAALAREAAAAIWAACGVPAFLYGAAAEQPERRLLAAVRRGEFEGLAARSAAGERPDVGDTLFHPSAGAIAAGARDVLVAFNLVLASEDLALARSIARTLRERDGGLRTLRVLGLRLSSGRVQVSCNVTDVAAVPLGRIVALVRALAGRAGVAVEGTELIGLVPRAAVLAVAEAELGLEPGELARGGPETKS